MTEERGGGGGCAQSYDGEKASSSINHSILSGQRGEFLQINGTFVKVAIIYLKVTRKL